MKSMISFTKNLNNAGYPVQDRFGRIFVNEGFPEKEIDLGLF